MKFNSQGFKRLSRGYKTDKFIENEKIRFTKNYLTAAVIGKPNVGKSKLYNSIIGTGSAIVHPTPGITRDWAMTEVKDFKFPFRFIDTGGIYYQNFNKKNQKKNKEIEHRQISIQEDSESFFAPGILEKCEEAMRKSNLLFFIVDARNGVTQEDMKIANYLKQRVIDLSMLDEEEVEEIKHMPVGHYGMVDDRIIVDKVVLVANKCEDGQTFGSENELYMLGMGDPLYVSAEEGDGMHQIWEEIDDLVSDEAKEYFKFRKKKRKNRYMELRSLLKEEVEEEIAKKGGKVLNFDINEWLFEFDLMNERPEDNSDFDTDSEVDPQKYMSKEIVIEKPGLSPFNYLYNRTVNLGIIGRPNAGKSSLLNSFIQDKRVLTSATSHTTTDTTDVNWVYNDVKLKLIDTAGIEKKSKKKKNVDNLIFKKTMKAIKGSKAVIVVIDALEAFINVDFDLINLCINEGKPVVLVVNKWDLVADKWKQRAAKFMVNQVEKQLGILNGVPVHFVSAKEGIRTRRVLDDVLRVYTAWNTRISTGLLNNWLNKFKRVQKLPTKRDMKLRIFYVSQIKVRPPTFSVFVNNIKMVDENYTKFVKKSLTEEFGFQGVPIRLTFRGIQYKDLKRRVEKVFEARKDEMLLRRIFLKRRKMKTFAKIKLDEVSSKGR